MIALVTRVAKKLDKDPLDLLPMWNEEVERALQANFGEQDSRAFTMAAKRFLARNKVEIEISDLLNSANDRARVTGGSEKVPTL